MRERIALAPSQASHRLLSLHSLAVFVVGVEDPGWAQCDQLVDHLDDFAARGPRDSLTAGGGPLSATSRTVPTRPERSDLLPVQQLVLLRIPDEHRRLHRLPLAQRWNQHPARHRGRLRGHGPPPALSTAKSSPTYSERRLPTQPRWPACYSCPGCPPNTGDGPCHSARRDRYGRPTRHHCSGLPARTAAAVSSTRSPLSSKPNIRVGRFSASDLDG